MKYFIVTSMKCKIAQTETLVFHERLLKKGHVFTENFEEADTVLFHPCKLRPASKWLIEKMKKKKKVFLLPCHTKEDIEQFKEVEILSPEKIHKEGLSSATLGDEEDKLVNIGYGCNQKCSFCPIKKEKAKSRPTKDILKDTKGSKITHLMMDDCSSYGDGEHDLVGLLKEILKQQKTGLIILNYVYPAYLLRNIDFFNKNKERVVIGVLPIQSASKRVLKIMNRSNYDPQEIVANIEKIRFFAVQLMFGHPEEKWEDFLETVNFAKKIEEKVQHEGIQWFVYNTYSGTEDERNYGEKRNILIPRMQEYLEKNMNKEKNSTSNLLYGDHFTIDIKTHKFVVLNQKNKLTK